MAITSIILSSLDGNNGFRVDGAAAGDYSGGSVSNAGDVNGDGFDDVLVGARDADPNGDRSGSSYVVFGLASGFNAAMDLSSLNGSNGFRLDGVAADDFSGTSVSNAGDVNGDGFDDLIIGASGADPNGDSSGSSYVVFGKASGFAAAVDLSSLDGSNGFRLDGTAVSNFSGRAVSGAGDINGDGFDDVIIGGGDDYPSPDTVDYVVFGKASGFSPTLNLSDLNGSNGFRLDVNSSYGAGTTSVSSAGDINGDGFDDVIVGILFYSSGSRSDPGDRESYVVFGRASGFDTAVNLSSLDDSDGFSLGGADVGPYGGALHVSGAGDINGDGLDDVIVGSRTAAGSGNSSSYYTGVSYVVFGRVSGFGTSLNLSDLNGSNGFRLHGVGEGDFLGGSVSGAGDVNGDGFDDLIVGAAGADPYDISGAGASYVVFGKGSGFDATIDLSNLDDSNGIRLDGVAEGDYAGASVSSAGDINSDGFDDLIVGAPRADTNGSDSGASYVLFGSSNFTGTGTLGTAGDDTLTGTPAIERFKAGDGNDIMIGGGGADVFNGDAGDDTIRVPDLDFRLVSGGTGSDTLELTGSGINLNLANFGGNFDHMIKGVETIDLTGSGDNTLTVTEQDLLDLSDTSNTLVVKGNVGDHVAGLSQGWSEGGVRGNFHTYIRHEAMLLIDSAVSTDPLTPSVINLSNLNGSNGFRLDGVAERDYLGGSVSNAGDVNGDGFADLIVGARGADPNGDRSGSSYVVFGKAGGFDAAMNLSSLDGSNGFRLDGVAERDYLGGSVSNAGDVNGDGFADVIVGAYGAGSSYVAFGRANGFAAVMDLSSLDGSNGFRLDGVEFRTGSSVSSAGDVNGDGFADVIIGGAIFASPNGNNNAGSSYVVFGKASGFDAAMDLSDLDGSNGFRLDGAAANDLSGGSVSNAGDVNGDGFDDLIIGASSADPNAGKTDASYVVFGKVNGFDAAMDLSDLDGSNGFRVEGESEFETGTLVSNAGDVNGDGFDDLIIGASGADPNGDNSGSSYVVFGKATGFAAAVELSSLDGSNGFRLDGAAAGNYSGFSVSNAGDVNGDGFDDLIVGNSRYSDNSSSSHVVFGKASGFGATLDLSSLNGSNGVRLDGVDLRAPVSGAGDVNGDGFDDLLVGAPYADPNGEDSGSSYVIFGRSNFGGGNVIAGTPGNDNLMGTKAAEIFEAGDGNDRMIGRGGADVFHGDAGDDYIQLTDLGFALVDGGTGDDVLHTDGKDLNLDLANFSDKIHGIETICLFGRGDNTLTLTAQDLLNLSDTDNTLKVNGNAGDHITVLDDGWVDEGSRGSGYFHVYTNDDAVLLVGMNVTVDFA